MNTGPATEYSEAVRTPAPNHARAPTAEPDVGTAKDSTKSHYLILKAGRSLDDGEKDITGLGSGHNLDDKFQYEKPQGETAHKKQRELERNARETHVQPVTKMDEAAPDADSPVPTAEPKPTKMPRFRAPTNPDPARPGGDVGGGGGGAKPTNYLGREINLIAPAKERLGRRYGAGAVPPGLRDPSDATPPTRPNREAYDRIRENPFRRTADEHTSTFSIDVDTASYANVRRFLNGGRLPPADAVRVEELINYFSYDYEVPGAEDTHPFKVNVEVAACPWNAQHRLARIALKGRVIKKENRPASNLVFLVDVSGSMRPQNKLPLLLSGLRMLVKELDEGDRVAICVYAGAAGVVLPSTLGSERATILSSLDRLQAGGSTNGGAGIQLAYNTARRNFIKGGINRVILCTDGDFNVGVTQKGDLTRLIEREAKSGVFLSVLGFGTGNYQDARMEALSNKGNGNYAYIDSIHEARKVLVDEMSGTLITIAKDVKIQVFFNPKMVAGWRLIGYENRILAAKDFNDDKKDAGEIGAGHTVTALYEIVPVGSTLPGPSVDQNPFVKGAKPAPASKTKEIATGEGALFRLRLRYKQPDSDKSTLMEQDVFQAGGKFDEASADFRFASAVASFGMLLRQNRHIDGANWGAVVEIAKDCRGKDPHGYRAEFLKLAETAAALVR